MHHPGPVESLCNPVYGQSHSEVCCPFVPWHKFNISFHCSGGTHSRRRMPWSPNVRTCNNPLDEIKFLCSQPSRFPSCMNIFPTLVRLHGTPLSGEALFPRLQLRLAINRPRRPPPLFLVFTGYRDSASASSCNRLLFLTISGWYTCTESAHHAKWPVRRFLGDQSTKSVMVGYHLYLCSPDVAVEFFHSPQKHQTILLCNRLDIFTFCQKSAPESVGPPLIKHKCCSCWKGLYCKHTHEMNLHSTLIHQRHKSYTRTWRPVERERGHINLVTSHVEAADDFFLTANGFWQPSIMRLPDLLINILFPHFYGPMLPQSRSRKRGDWSQTALNCLGRLSEWLYPVPFLMPGRSSRHLSPLQRSIRPNKEWEV